MNIIRRELKSSIVHSIIWSLAFAFLAYSAIIKYESIADMGPALDALLDRFPRIILALFYMAQTQMTTLAGYFSIVATMMLTMIASHGLFYGIRLFAREEQEKTADFLLTRPRSRQSIYVSKAAAGMVVALILQGVLYICHRAALAAHMPEARDLLHNYSMVFVAQHLFFLSLGILLITTLPRGRAESVGVALILGLYLIPVAAEMSESMTFLKEIFPFHAFVGPEMAEAGGIELMKLFILIGFTLISLLLGCCQFKKKDIYI